MADYEEHDVVSGEVFFHKRAFDDAHDEFAARKIIDEELETVAEFILTGMVKRGWVR